MKEEKKSYPKSKRPRRPSFLHFFSSKAVWVLLLTLSRTALPQTISTLGRVELRELGEGWSQHTTPGPSTSLKLFGGSLIQGIQQPPEQKTHLEGEGANKLTFDFRLLQNQERVLKSSYRVKLEVATDLSKLSNGVYKDELDPENRHRFSVSLFKNSESFRGLEPRVRIEHLNLTKLTFQANLTKESGVDLVSLILELSLPQDSTKRVGSGLSLNFSTSANTEEKITGSESWYYINTPWLIPSLFLTFIIYFFGSAFSVVLVKLVARQSINRDLKARNHPTTFMYESFFIFSKLRLISLASLVFLYSSPWTLLIFGVLVILELLEQSVVWVIPQLMADGLCD